ncbi:MAG: hypothetical protein ABR558_05600, partial [Thioalkalivibrio sp.]
MRLQLFVFIRLKSSSFRVLVTLPCLFIVLFSSLASAQDERFSREHVIKAARELAEHPYVPLAPVPDALLALNYDQYRS